MNEFYNVEIQTCRESLFEFVQSINTEHQFIWYHKLIADTVQQVVEGKIKKVMIFLPPQHQKSTIASRNGVAWAFGKNPDIKIIHCAYGIDLVSGFSRDIQRIIDSQFYNDIFPETYLNESNVRSDAKKGYKRTVELFELVNKKGSYYCSGVGGGITGQPCDIGIIDDPLRGAMDAASKTIRDKIWEWYISDFKTRLHNESRQILIQTRWHNDDLAGRLLEIEKDWEIICLPAIKENNDCEYDIRQIGEALHPKMHSLESLHEKQKLSPRSFAALYQQNPTIEGGNIIKSEWFNYAKDIPDGATDIWIDTAYTKKQTNDPTGVLATKKYNGKMYIIDARKVYLEFPQLITFISNYSQVNPNSIIRIEPKSCGESVIQVFNQKTNLNVVRTKTPTADKESRASVASVHIEGGNVILVTDNWNDEFINEVCNFPNDKHDEYVDLLGYATDHYFGSSNPLIIW